MAFYRKKPVVIEARRFTGTHQCMHEMINWASSSKTPMTIVDDGESRRLRIFTLESFLFVDPGDYIIKGVKGEFYPCKPDIFQMTYEPAV